MIIPNMEELYKPYSENADLQTSLMYWSREAKNLNIPESIMNVCIAEAFTEMASGKTFPVGECHCSRCGEAGFPVKWSCVALNHYVLEKMLGKKQELDQSQAQILQSGIEAAMLSLISKNNKEYIDANMKKNRFLDWSRSPVLNMFRKK